MTSKRERLKPDVLVHESRMISIFCLERTERCDEAKTCVYELFNAYKTWCKERFGSEPYVNIDGFGRLLPTESFPRTNRYMDGSMIRARKGIKLVN